MTYKWLGAALVVTGCGGFGFSLAAAYRRKEKYLRQLLYIIKYMEGEMQYHLTPLPELCRQAGKNTVGTLGGVFLNLAQELDDHTAPDVQSCMLNTLHKFSSFPTELKEIFVQLSRILGKFDLAGQVQGLQEVYSDCTEELAKLRKDRDARIRSYQTLGLCAGVALAILFL